MINISFASQCNIIPLHEMPRKWINSLSNYSFMHISRFAVKKLVRFIQSLTLIWKSNLERDELFLFRSIGRNLTEKPSPAKVMADYEASFNPEKYFTDFYSQIAGSPAETGFLKFQLRNLCELYDIIPLVPGQKLLDFGCGPTIHGAPPPLIKSTKSTWQNFAQEIDLKCRSGCKSNRVVSIGIQYWVIFFNRPI